MLDMLDIVVPEALQAVYYQPGGVTSDGAVGGVDDAAGRLFNDGQRGHIGLAVQHQLDQLGQLSQADTAGYALAAGLGMAQLQKGQRHIHRTQTGRRRRDTALYVTVEVIHHSLRFAGGFDVESAQGGHSFHLLTPF